MTIRSAQLGNFNFSGNGINTIYTVPAGYVALIKSVSFYLVSGSLTVLLFGVKPSGSSTPRWAGPPSFPTAAGQAGFWNPWIVAEPGDVIQLNQTGTSPQLIGLVSGALLTLS